MYEMRARVTCRYMSCRSLQIAFCAWCSWALPFYPCHCHLRGLHKQQPVKHYTLSSSVLCLSGSHHGLQRRICVCRLIVVYELAISRSREMCWIASKLMHLCKKSVVYGKGQSLVGSESSQKQSLSCRGTCTARTVQQCHSTLSSHLLH